MKLIKFCKDCGRSNTYHIQTWLRELTDRLLPHLSFPKKLEQFFDLLLEKLFTVTRLASLKKDFDRSDIQLRTACFIKEAEKAGIKFKVLQGPFGYTNHFRAELDGKIFRFDGLPIADFAGKSKIHASNDKQWTKNRLQRRNFPTAEGKSFWFWQKKRAVNFGVNQLGFPLVVKPRSGSVSRHVTTDIRNVDELKQAIHKAIIYSPTFIVEKFIPDVFVYRATVVDFNTVACVKQVPANVIGDGLLTIEELVDEKNNDPHRGLSHQKEFTLYQIVINETTMSLLGEKRYQLSSVPQRDEVVYLQKNPFLKLGGDLIEVTSQMHPDNINLFRDVAKLFDMRVTGIDFVTEDIFRSWEDQRCAILELNSVPCIELHHFPSAGKPQNVAQAMVDLFFKYYL